jgi:hypothetical protein
MDPMIKRLLCVVFPLLLLLSACAPGASAFNLPALPFVVTITPRSLPQNTPTQVKVTEAPVLLPALWATVTEAATLIPVTQIATLIPATQTESPTNTPVLPTPTETLLPPLELPTEASRPPRLMTWTGLPTYPGDSDPGLLFRVDYDPDKWAQTEGNYGDIVLANRQIEYCTITPWTGRGLPVDWKVSHDFRAIGSTAYDVNTVTSQGVVKFVSYVGGDHHIQTGFQVLFIGQQDQCLLEAEGIFASLRSFAAIPTATATVAEITPPVSSSTPTP